MIRSTILFVAVAVGLIGAALRYDDAFAGSRAEAAPIPLALGDRVEVSDGNVGCRVARPSALRGRTGLDCRRAGALSGTYGVFMGDRRVVVARFRSARTAKVVFVAHREGASRRCG